MKRILLVLLIQVVTMTLSGQGDQSDYANKVSSIDAIIETLYSVISGDAGVERDWDLFRYLFTENAHLIPLATDSSGKTMPVFLSPEDYISRSGDFLVENGFFENELYRLTESYGALTHIFSTYEAFRSSSDELPFMRGINSIQLVNDGERWWITNIQWFRETEEHPLPAKYLPKH